MVFIRIIVWIWSKWTYHLTQKHQDKECFCKDNQTYIVHYVLHFCSRSCYVSRHMQANCTWDDGATLEYIQTVWERDWNLEEWEIFITLNLSICFYTNLCHVPSLGAFLYRIASPYFVRCMIDLCNLCHVN